MHKHKFLKAILVIAIVFSTLFSFSVSNATTVVFDGNVITREEIEEFSKMVNSFLEYAMKSYSDKAKKREKFERQNNSLQSK